MKKPALERQADYDAVQEGKGEEVEDHDGANVAGHLDYFYVTVGIWILRSKAPAKPGPGSCQSGLLL